MDQRKYVQRFNSTESYRSGVTQVDPLQSIDSAQSRYSGEGSTDDGASFKRGGNVQTRQLPATT
jgi:hypothetical protein